jgi:phospholipase/carboxylesterase
MANMFLIFLFTGVLVACQPTGPEVFHLKSRITAPSNPIEPGEHSLGLGGSVLVNGQLNWRDGTLYVPKVSNSSEKLPLLMWLHGGGGRSRDTHYLFPLAEEFGVAILTLDARHNTWDGIDSPYGPDVLFIDEALKHTFERVAIDPQRIAMGGLSDGGAYTLAIGRVNGDLFSHLVAVAPGHLKPPASTVGQPEIFVAHGIRDNVYRVTGSRNYIVPDLKSAGYDVTYLEFDGPHWMIESVAREVLQWLAESSTNSKK